MIEDRILRGTKTMVWRNGIGRRWRTKKKEEEYYNCKGCRETAGAQTVTEKTGVTNHKRR